MATKSFSIEDGNLQSRSIITTRKRIYKDLDLTFARAPNNDVYKKTDTAAVKQSIKNILLTNRLEKPFDPLFGGGLGRFLFSLDTEFDEEEMEYSIREAIENYEPRARVNRVRVTVNGDNNDVKANVQFQILNTLERSEIELTIARLR